MAVRRSARIIGTMVAALALVAGAGGCGAGSGTKDAKATTLTVVATNYGDSVHKNSQGYWDRVGLAFQATHPGVRVVTTVYPADTVDAKVAALVKRGKAPDVVQTGSFAEYAAAGKLYSADELLSIPVQAGFVRSLADAGKVAGTQYGLPFTASTRLLYYNKDLFRQAGLKAPATWQELLVDARVLKARGVKYPIALPFGPEEAEAETLGWLLAGEGGYTNNAGSYDLASDANVSTLTWLRSNLVEAGLTGPVAPGRLNRGAALTAFVDGEAAMVNAPLSLMRQIEDSSTHVSYGTVALPSRTGKTVPTMGTADWITAFKQGGHRELTGAFLDFLYGDKYVREQAAEYQLLPVTASVSARMRADGRYKRLWNGLDALGNVSLYPLSETSWSRVSAAIRSKIGASVAPGGDPRAVLTSIAKTAR
ncbi:extracellular solute-binding protein [Streptomyces sp. NPDC002935]|uniref:extracellular solute-binding protein n=1 Tax=Streptomyces sp. NPDC002935 TaxID=3154545 RepID=UPI0033B7EFA6